MDEPCSALGPIATAKIEELIHQLRGRYAIVIVTHNMQQAARVSQRPAFFHLGTLVEYGDTSEIFTNPRETRTTDNISAPYGREGTTPGHHSPHRQTLRPATRQPSRPNHADGRASQTTPTE